MKKFTKMLVLALAMVFMVGAGDVAEAKGKVTKVQITKVGKTNVTKKSKLTIKRDGENKKVQLTAKATVKGGASKTLTYKSSNSKVISVSKTGMMTIKKAGKATITVKSKQNSKKSDKITITVKQNVTSVKLSKVTGKKISQLGNVVSVQKGKKITLKAAVAPKTASVKKVSFKSSKKSVATVNSKGVVTAKKPGTAKITISAKDGSKKKLTVTVFVTKKISKKVTKVEATLDAKNEVLLAGETAQIKATVTPDKATLKKVAYKSSNTKVAKVDAVTGKVTAVAPGKATITVQAMDGSKKKATVEVVVGEEFTKVAPKEGAKASVKVSFAGDAKKAAADVEKLLKTVMKDGDSKTVTINGNTDKVAIVKDKDGKEIVVVGEAKTPLADYIANKKADNDTVEVVYTTKAAKAVAAIELAKFAAVGEYAYDITIDGFKATKIVVTTEGIELTVDGTVYTGTVEAGVIYVDGDVTADKAIENVKKYADVTVVRK